MTDADDHSNWDILTVRVVRWQGGGGVSERVLEADKSTPIPLLCLYELSVVCGYANNVVGNKLQHLINPARTHCE